MPETSAQRISKNLLSFLSEVGKSQTFRRLIFFFLAEAYHDQNHDSNHIRNHLDQIGNIACHLNSKNTRKELIQPVEHSKQVSTPDCIQRLPSSENYKRNSQPAKSFNLSCSCPDSLVVIQYIIQAANTGKTCTNTGCQIFILCNINTCCICCSRIFSYCTKIQTYSCFVQYIVKYTRKP